MVPAWVACGLDCRAWASLHVAGVSILKAGMPRERGASVSGGIRALGLLHGLLWGPGYSANVSGNDRAKLEKNTCSYILVRIFANEFESIHVANSRSG